MDVTTKQFFLERKEEDAENGKCVDCGAPHPQWASVNLGAYFCLLCSGQHRSLGVHLSFVRSITMDTWSDKQKASMQLGGNARLKKALIDHGVDPSSKTIAEKYNTKAAEWHRQSLRSEVMGEAAPPPLAAGEGPLPAFAPAAASTTPGAMFGGSSASSSSQQHQSGFGFGFGSSSSSSGGGGTGGGGSRDSGGGDLFGAAVGGFWSAMGSAAAMAEKAKQTATEKAKTIDLPQDSGAWVSAMGSTVAIGLARAKEATGKAYETVTDESFLEKVKTHTASGFEKVGEVAAVGLEKSKQVAQMAHAEMDRQGFGISGFNPSSAPGSSSRSSSDLPPPAGSDLPDPQSLAVEAGAGGVAPLHPSAAQLPLSGDVLSFSASNSNTYSYTGTAPPAVPPGAGAPDPFAAGSASLLVDDLDFLNDPAPAGAVVGSSSGVGGGGGLAGAGATSAAPLGMPLPPAATTVITPATMISTTGPTGTTSLKKPDPGDDWLDDFPDF